MFIIKWDWKFAVSRTRPGHLDSQTIKDVGGGRKSEPDKKKKTKKQKNKQKTNKKQTKQNQQKKKQKKTKT